MQNQDAKVVQTVENIFKYKPFVDAVNIQGFEQIGTVLDQVILTIEDKLKAGEKSIIKIIEFASVDPFEADAEASKKI